MQRIWLDRVGTARVSSPPAGLILWALKCTAHAAGAHAGAHAGRSGMSALMVTTTATKGARGCESHIAEALGDKVV